MKPNLREAQEKIYKGLTAEQLEAQYNLRALRPNLDSEVIQHWMARSKAVRGSAEARIDLAYGEGAREKLDFFPTGKPGGPLLIYIHGGYWQSGDKAFYSFLAAPFTEAGVSLAVINYDLCPSVPFAAIAPQVRNAIAWLWRQAPDLGVLREAISVMGHSAGGHLTAAMMATDWPGLGDDLPKDLIKAGVPISALFELLPLVTTSINNKLGLDETVARAQSPCFMTLPSNAPQLVVVGGRETAEFHRQADDYVARFATAERRLERYSEPGVDHFDLINRLAEPESAFFQKVLGLARDK